MLIHKSPVTGLQNEPILTRDTVTQWRQMTNRSDQHPLYGYAICISIVIGTPGHRIVKCCVTLYSYDKRVETQNNNEFMKIPIEKSGKLLPSYS